MIRFEGIEVSYADFIAIPNLNLTIEDGEFFTLLGPSGCGKTTALRTLAGLTLPSAGDIFVDDKRITELPPDKRDVGMVFQNYALFPSMSVAQNIEFGLRVRKVSTGERAREVSKVAELVGLAPIQLDKNLDELSGGQQQRVAIARALVLQPKILLLDEPLSNLDAKLRGQMRVQLKRLQHEVGITTVYVTHDQDEAMAMSDRIAVFNAGVVDQVGTPQEVYDHSATEFVCNFLGESSVLGADLLAVLARGGDQNPNQLTPRADLRPGVRAYLREEKARLQPLPGLIGVDGHVLARHYHGTHSSYEIDCHGTALQTMVSETGERRPEAGEAITLWLNPEHVLVYPNGATS